MTLGIEPGSPEWRAVITPSKVAAILGVSRWESTYRLWHRLKGLVDAEPPKDIFDLGHDFEPAMAAIWKRRNPGWQLSPGEVQIVAPDKFGYPAAVTLDRRARRGKARKVIEFKTARHLEDWGDFFTDQAPADYVAQILAQMAYTGYTKHPAELLVLGPYFQAHTYVIGYDMGVVAVIHQRCNDFWQSLKGDVPPELDDSVATYECVRQLHPDINGGETVRISRDDALYLLLASEDEKHSKTRLRVLKTQILDRMGNAQYACVGEGDAEIRVATRSPHASGSVALNLSTKSIPALQDQEELRTA